MQHRPRQRSGYARAGAWVRNRTASALRPWAGERRGPGGVALAALMSGAFVVTVGFGGPVRQEGETSTASAETCALGGVTPAEVVAGAAAVRREFAVTYSGCTATWSLAWPAAGVTATHEVPAATIDVPRLRNDDAGRSNAYVTLSADDGTSTRTPVPVTLKRRTTWTALNASPEPGRKGRALTLRATLGRADWDANAYRGYPGRPVVVQFRAKGESAFANYRKAETGKGGVLKVTVKAKRSGAWRVVFAGNGVSAAATSSADAVTVLPVPKDYANCAALNDVYPHGVGLPGATDQVSGSTEPVTGFVRDRPTAS